MTESRINLALDDMGLVEAMGLTSRIGSRVRALKMHSLFDLTGPKAVDYVRKTGAKRIWIDAKLNDTPDTVRQRALALAKSGADIITVHASGGIEMMKAAVESGIEIYAVTVLTSLSEEAVQRIYGKSAIAAARGFALDAKEAGVAGIVCSPQEVRTLANDAKLRGMKFIVPGSRSAGVTTHDQQRVDTPGAVMRAGASELVVGRQITQAVYPLAALEALEQEIAEANPSS